MADCITMIVALLLLFFIDESNCMWNVLYDRFEETFRYDDAKFMKSNNTQIARWINPPRMKVRYDDGWEAISTPIKAPSLVPTKYPTKHPIKTKGKRDAKHIIKLYSINRENEFPSNMFGIHHLENYMMHNYFKNPYDQILAKRAHSTHPKSDKIQIYQTNVDIIYEDIYRFFATLYQPNLQSNEVYSSLLQTVSNLKEANMSHIFSDIYAVLALKNQNDSHALDLCHHLHQSHNNQTTESLFIDHNLMPVVLDFCINALDAIFDLVMKELHFVCNPKQFPCCVTLIIRSHMNLKNNIWQKMRVLINAFQNTVERMYDGELVKDRIVQIAEGLNGFNLQIVAIKEDLEITSILYEWMELYNSSTIYIVSDVLHHRVLETLLLYFDDVRMNKYFAQKIKKKFHMMQIPKLNVTKLGTKPKKTKNKKSSARSRNHDIITLANCMDVIHYQSMTQFIQHQSS